MKNRKKTFFRLPQIIGGKETFKKYVENNLVYPAEALEKQIEGIVHLNAEIDDNGKVIKIEILHGLDGGCNEEAIRLIKNIRFGAVKNNGIRLKTKRQFKIKFQIPVTNHLNYVLKSKTVGSNRPISDNKYSYIVLLQ
jgi:protein TonB